MSRAKLFAIKMVLSMEVFFMNMEVWYSSSHQLCYVRQCWLICSILLGLSRGMVSCILLFILGALWYTMLIFRFPSLCSLRQYGDIMWLIYVTIINLFYFSIFQYHSNITTNISNKNVHLTVIDSLRVPPLLAYNLSNLGVILVLFYLDSCLLPHWLTA